MLSQISGTPAISREWKFDTLISEGDTICDTFTGNYAGSAKQPDFLIRPDLAPYPSIIVECGWIESFPQLRKDKDLWIRGCGGFVKLVILIKFSKLAKERVSGKIEVWASDATAHDRLIQTEPIFPLPSAPFGQPIKVTRSQLFGGLVLPGCNPEDVLEFPLDMLQIQAQKALSVMGLQPAQ